MNTRFRSVCVSLAAAFSPAAGAAQTPAPIAAELHAPHGARFVAGEWLLVARGPGRVELPPGPVVVHFPSDALGKPRSLAVDVPLAGAVTIHVPFAAPAVMLPLPRAALVPSVVARPPRAAWVLGGPAVRAVRAEVTFAAGAGAIGVVARHDPERGGYVLWADRAAGQLVLERWLGQDRFELGSVAVPLTNERPHTVSLQADGFRLEAWLDDAVVLQRFDGAHSDGAFGVAFLDANDAEQPWSLRTAPPAAPRASAALVREPERAVLHAASTAPPKSLAVVELTLDVPSPATPRSPSGAALTTLQGPAGSLLPPWPSAPIEVPVDGMLRAELALPKLPAMYGHVLQASFVLLSADGAAVLGRTPAVPLTF